MTFSGNCVHEIHAINKTKEYTLINTFLLETVLSDFNLNAHSAKLWQILYNKARFNPNLEVKIAQRELSFLLGKSIRTIQRYISTLVQQGYLQIIENYRKNGERQENTFYICAPKDVLLSALKAKNRIKTKDYSSTSFSAQKNDNVLCGTRSFYRQANESAFQEYLSTLSAISDPHSVIKPSATSLIKDSNKLNDDEVLSSQTAQKSISIPKQIQSNEIKEKEERKKGKAILIGPHDKTDRANNNKYNKINNNIPRIKNMETKTNKIKAVVFSFNNLFKKNKVIKKTIKEGKREKEKSKQEVKTYSLQQTKEIFSVETVNPIEINFEELKPQRLAQNTKKFQDTHTNQIKLNLINFQKKEEEVEKIRLRKKELNQKFLSETDQIKKFEVLQVLGQIESTYERTAFELEQLKTQIQKQKTTQVFQSQLQTNPCFMAKKRGGREISEFTLRRIFKILESYGYERWTKIKLINEIIFESRFGSLVKNNLTKEENSIDLSINIALKLIREGRWNTPSSLNSYSFLQKEIG